MISRKINVLKCALISGTALLSIAASPAWAQTAPAVDENAEASDQGEIIVTAQRRAERLEDVPVSIVALTGEGLEKTGVQRLSDLGQIAAGVQINRGGSFTQPAIRGITTLTLGYTPHAIMSATTTNTATWTATAPAPSSTSAPARRA